MEKDNSYHPMQIVLVSSYIHEIQLAQLLLEHNGIKSIIIDEHLSSIMGTGYVEGYKLKVFELDFEQAKSIIQLFKST